MSPAEVVGLLVKLGTMVGKDLVTPARQLEPKLREEPLPAEDEDMQDARAAALARARSDADEIG